MFGIGKSSYVPENFFAGDFPIAKDVGAVKDGTEIRRHAPVVLGEGGLEEAAAASLDKLAGIAAACSVGGEVVYYLTGEFFADAIELPAGVSLEELKPALRKLGIFLKEMKASE